MDSQKPITQLRKRKRPNHDVGLVAPPKQPARTRRKAKQTASTRPDTVQVLAPSQRSPTADLVQESTLCEVCRAVLDKYELVEDLRTILLTSEDLESRAKHGCRLCALFFGLLTDEEKTRLDRRTRRHKLEYIKSRELQCKSLSSRRLIISSGDLADPDSISRDILLVPAGAIDDYSYSLRLDGSTASEQSITVARTWLRECSTQHSCRKHLGGFVPTRLVDVGTASIPEPRLCLSEDLASLPRYLTLSHCWGQTVTTRLLKDNLISMTGRIDYDQLPKTFQEALSVTHQLGERYLWIDSLCIIQDCPKDWQDESAMMSSVYSYSWCNISATFAKDGSQGLFVERDPEAVQSVRVVLGKGSRKPIFGYAVDPDFWRKEVIDAPLNQRAWVCQERLLSPCNLHFCSEQLVWECRCFVACEMFPKGLPTGLPQASSSTHGPMIKLEAGEVIGSSLIRNNTNMESTRKIYDLWKAVVNLYTSASLSHETDKLVAIGGLASSLMKTADDKYLSGLWANDLPNQLLWTALKVGRRHSQYIAPTWSWASVKSGVTFSHAYAERSRRVNLVTIVSSDVDHVVERNPYGQVRGASLSVKGNLARAGFAQNDDEPSRGLVIHESSLIEPEAEFASGPASFANVVWDALDEAELLQLGGTFLLLPVLWLGGDQQEAGSQREEDVIVGLVLRASGDSPGRFRREAWFSYGMGVMENSDSPGIMDGCRYFDSLAAESDLEYEKDGDGCFKYLITII